MKDFFKKRLSLAITLVLFVFCVMLATFLLVGGSIVLLQHLGVISFSDRSLSEGAGGNMIFPVFALFGLCILLGTALTAFFSKKALNPIKKVIDATHRVTQGDFSVEVNIKGIHELEELSRSFNKMTHELSAIETLRSDFVNNFSHEFKTPIVSIRGFAKLLKENSLTEEERKEYLDIIMTESQRLAELSTNVLTLSKYENTEIITEKIPFQLDEQIRRTVLLLEPKWSAKEIAVNIYLDDVVYYGNEDLMQQIWLNLFDNAVKYSCLGGAIGITLKSSSNGVTFAIEDEGCGMDGQTIEHIFDKFYQGDHSHTKAGNGLGLTLVKRILELCCGTVHVKSEVGKGSTFIVFLPKGQ